MTHLHQILCYYSPKKHKDESPGVLLYSRPCLTLIGGSALSPADPDTNPVPPEFPQPYACKHHLEKKKEASLKPGNQNRKWNTIRKQI